MDFRLQAFKEEILSYTDQLSEEEWDEFQARLRPVSFKKGQDVFPVSEVCKKALFTVEGILASEFQTKEGSFITRFFKSKDLCSNIVSLFSQQLAHDRVFAITPVEGILIPYDLLLDHYLNSNTVGLYFRKRILETLLTDKNFMSMKTIPGVEPKLSFLHENYPEVILEAPWKHIANFMGVTPAWLSRVLKKRDAAR